jgi:hypothetical protein
MAFTAGFPAQHCCYQGPSAACFWRHNNPICLSTNNVMRGLLVTGVPTQDPASGLSRKQQQNEASCQQANSEVDTLTQALLYHASSFLHGRRSAVVASSFRVAALTQSYQAAASGALRAFLALWGMQQACLRLAVTLWQAVRGCWL